MSDLPMRVLAVLGAAAVGAFGTGGMLNIAARLTMTRQKLPVWVHRFVRLLGAVVLGWLAALWMFGSGLGGFGGPGGWGLGPGSGLGKGDTLAPTEQVKEKPTEAGPEPLEPSESVQIEILGASAVERGGGAKGSGGDHRYRLDSGKNPQLLSLAELKDYLRGRQKGDHPLRQVILVLYLDSPERRTAAVADLKRWIEEDLPAHAKGETILLSVDLRAQNAPAK
jgi:hypothetical protein